MRHYLGIVRRYRGRRASILFLLAAAVTACARQAAPNAYNPPSFLLGLFHGFIVVFSFIGSLFTDVRIYAFPNTSVGMLRRHAAPVVVVGCLTAVSCVTFVNSAVDKGKARYVGGSARSGTIKATTVPGPSGKIRTTSDSELVFDAGRDGTLTISYAAISSLVYGPALFPRIENGVRRWASLRPSKYPWSGSSSHRSRSHFLKIVLRDETGKEGDIVLGLGQDIVRSTLGILERRTGHAIAFETIDACRQYKSSEECGYGTPAELKGLTTVFVDTSARLESMDQENSKRLISTITEAGLGVEVKSRPEDAAIILAFRYYGGSRPTCSAGPNYGPDWAVGEVYVVGASGLRVVMLFDEECRIWRRWLATTFGEAFVRAYKQANGLK